MPLLPSHVYYEIEKHNLTIFIAFARTPMLVTLCETTKRAVVRDDKIEIAPIAMVNFTVDHRFLDGGRVKKLMGKV